MTVFDMDGVLFDSERAVLDSYREAGAETCGDMPMGLTWQQWLVPRLGYDEAERIHDLKNRIYNDKIQMGLIPGLPPLALLTARIDDSAVITSASHKAATGLLRYRLGTLYTNVHLGYGLNVLSKGSHLHDIGRVDRIFIGKYEHYVYIDDRKDLGQRVVDIANGMCSSRHLDPRWTFVHYHRQSLEELTEEVGL